MNQLVAKFASDALFVQDACNLTGVVGSLARHSQALVDAGMSLEELKAYPSVTLFVSKISDLTWSTLSKLESSQAEATQLLEESDNAELSLIIQTAMESKFKDVPTLAKVMFEETCKLRKHCNGSDELSWHPVSRLYAIQLMKLTDHDSLSYFDAYDACKALEKNLVTN